MRYFTLPIIKTNVKSQSRYLLSNDKQLLKKKISKILIKYS